MSSDGNIRHTFESVLHFRPLARSCALVHSNKISIKPAFITVCEVEASSIISDLPISLFIHESTWAEEIRSSGSCAVDSGYVWSNTAEGTAQSAGSYELVEIP